MSKRRRLADFNYRFHVKVISSLLILILGMLLGTVLPAAFDLSLIASFFILFLSLMDLAKIYELESEE